MDSTSLILGALDMSFTRCLATACWWKHSIEGRARFRGDTSKNTKETRTLRVLYFQIQMCFIRHLMLDLQLENKKYGCKGNTTLATRMHNYGTISKHCKNERDKG